LRRLALASSSGDGGVTRVQQSSAQGDADAGDPAELAPYAAATEPEAAPWWELDLERSL
jgi:hypothetical protein